MQIRLMLCCAASDTAATCSWISQSWRFTSTRRRSELELFKESHGSCCREVATPDERAEAPVIGELIIKTANSNTTTIEDLQLEGPSRPRPARRRRPRASSSMPGQTAGQARENRVCRRLDPGFA